MPCVVFNLFARKSTILIQCQIPLKNLPGSIQLPGRRNKILIRSYKLQDWVTDCTYWDSYANLCGSWMVQHLIPCVATGQSTIVIAEITICLSEIYHILHVHLLLYMPCVVFNLFARKSTILIQCQIPLKNLPGSIQLPGRRNKILIRSYKLQDWVTDCTYWDSYANLCGSWMVQHLIPCVATGRDATLLHLSFSGS